MNTKNDEHEEFVQKLRSLHEEEVQRLLVEGASKLQKCEEGLAREREVGERKVRELRGRLEEIEQEREQLLETQVSLCYSTAVVSGMLSSVLLELHEYPCV